MALTCKYFVSKVLNSRQVCLRKQSHNDMPDSKITRWFCITLKEVKKKLILFSKVLYFALERAKFNAGIISQTVRNF